MTRGIFLHYSNVIGDYGEGIAVFVTVTVMMQEVVCSDKSSNCLKGITIVYLPKIHDILF